MLCSYDARNYDSKLDAICLPLHQLSAGKKVDLYLHNEPRNGKTLFDTFFSQVSMALFPYVDRRVSNVVTPSQAAYSVSFSLPSAAVSLLRLEKFSGKEMFNCDYVRKKTSLRNTALGISTKRRIEYCSEQAIAFDYGSYQSNSIRHKTFSLHTSG